MSGESVEDRRAGRGSDILWSAMRARAVSLDWVRLARITHAMLSGNGVALSLVVLGLDLARCGARTTVRQFWASAVPRGYAVAKAGRAQIG